MPEFIVTHVKAGETLSGIAARYGVSVDALQRWNRIENPDSVLVGQRIVIYTTADAVGSVDSLSPSNAPIAKVPPEFLVGGAILLGLLLLLVLRRKRPGFPPTHLGPSPRRSRPASRQGAPAAKRPDHTLGDTRHVADPLPEPQVNEGERRVSFRLRRWYPDWELRDNVMLRSGWGTTQIDHILVSPTGAVFLIETKDLNGWIFGSPGVEQWTQSFPAGRRSRSAGMKSEQFKFYNPLRQNEGHAKALVRLGIVDRRRLRPIVVFVGDASMKTGDQFLPIDQHEKMARRNSTWRMRGVVCMSMAEMRRYIDFSVKAVGRQRMETIGDRIRREEIPITAESHGKHVDFVQSVKEWSSRRVRARGRRCRRRRRSRPC